MPLSLDRLLDYRVAMEMTSSPVADPLNLTSTMAIMYSVLLELLELISPAEGTSLLYPALVEGGLSSFSLFYYRIRPLLSGLISDDILGEFNAMASNSWVLLFRYTRNNETTDTTIPIFFLPTGAIDNTRTSELALSTIETILAPSLRLLNQTAIQQGVDVDFWKLVNFIFIGYHWLMLANLGQISPTIYAPILFPPAPEWYRVNFTNVKSYTPINNIFINETLFEIYTNFLRDTILPLLNYSSPRFAPLGDGNTLQMEQTTFIKSYDCQVRTLRSPVVAMFLIVTTVVVFITGPYAFVTNVFARIQRHKPGGYSFLYLLDGR